MAPTDLTRRAALRLPVAAAAGAALAACRGDAATPPDPADVADVDAVTSALAAETQLLALAVRLRDTEATGVLRRHVSVLGSSLRPTATPSVTASGGPAETPATGAALAAGLREAADAHRAALPTVSAAVARLLASVAASDRALAAWTLRAGS